MIENETNSYRDYANSYGNEKKIDKHGKISVQKIIYTLIFMPFRYIF